MMKSTAANSGLRRLLFAGGLVATGVAAVLSPDWSAVLKAQGYYGSVDLSIEVDRPGYVLPGGELVLDIVARNQGPDTAHRVRSIAAAPQLTFVSSYGCSPGYPQCALGDSLDVGHQAGYILTLRVPDDARNHVQFSVSVTSDDTENNPGDEIVVMKIPVRVLLDLRSDIACARANATGDRAVIRCSIRFLNSSPQAARQPFLRASVSTATTPLSWSCEASQPLLCAGATAQGSGYSVMPSLLPAWSSVTFFVETQARGAASVITLDAEAQLNQSMGEFELNPGDNRSTLQFEPSLFADGFGPAG
jgi:hypothetical protein